jgi:hypothetical protein
MKNRGSMIVVAVGLAVGGCLAWFHFRPAPVPSPVDLTKYDGKTIDFSSGKPVVKDTPQDRAVIAQAKKEMADAALAVTFRVIPPPVDLLEHDGKTIDFSSGKPEIKDTPEDRAAIAEAQKEMDAAARSMTFGPTPKKFELPPTPPAPPKP